MAVRETGGSRVSAAMARYAKDRTGRTVENFVSCTTFCVFLGVEVHSFFGKGNWTDTEKTDIERRDEARKGRAVPLTVHVPFIAVFFSGLMM